MTGTGARLAALRTARGTALTGTEVVYLASALGVPAAEQRGDPPLRPTAASREELARALAWAAEALYAHGLTSDARHTGSKC